MTLAETKEVPVMNAEPQITQRPPLPYAGLPATATMTNFASVIDAGFPEVFGWLGEHGIEPAGPPFIRYNVIDMDGDLEVELAVPVAGEAAAGGQEGRVRAGVLPGGRYVTLLHAGHYDGLIGANAALQQWAADQGVALESSPDQRRWRGRVEHYNTDPSAEPDPAKWQTEVAYLIGDEPAGGR
jgi:effector-binding domain-containing protein